VGQSKCKIELDVPTQEEQDRPAVSYLQEGCRMTPRPAGQLELKAEPVTPQFRRRSGAISECPKAE